MYHIAIGDLHGYQDKFLNLMYDLETKFNFKRDTLVFLGDYVDGGYQGAEVVAILRQLQRSYPHWVFLRGNHEQLMIDAFRNPGNYVDQQNWLRNGGHATVTSYMTQPSHQMAEDVAWMETLPFYYETNKYIFVHAGLRPNTSKISDTSDMEKMWIRDEFLDTDFDFWGKYVVAGHTYHIAPYIMPNLACIDTMAHTKGSPSALALGKDRRDLIVISH